MTDEESHPFLLKVEKLEAAFQRANKQVSVTLIPDFHVFYLFCKQHYVLGIEAFVQFHLCRVSVL